MMSFRHRILFLIFLLFILLSCKQLKATTTYTVGAAGNYATIALAYAACTAATDYVIEIRSDYANTEAKPITLGALANKSAVNNIIIRPNSATALTITTTNAQVFYFNAGDYVTIDGRPNGVGASVLILQNTSTSASKWVIQFAGDAIYNTIQYCTLKGSNASTTTSTAGIINFSTSAAGGNDNNTITNCTLQMAGANKPREIIASSGSSLANNNSSITISNNNLVDATYKFMDLGNFNSAWIISGNSFYQSTAITPSNNTYFIFINSGGGYTISSNYMGGQASICGGSAFTINAGAYSFYGVYFSSSVSGSACGVSGNTIKNITSNTTNSFFPFYLDANAVDHTVRANIIQDITTAATIFYGVYCASTGTNTINANTFGGSSSNNMTLSANSRHYGIVFDALSGTAVCDSNTIQQFNISNTGTSTSLTIIVNSGMPTFTCRYNTIKNIICAGTSTATYNYCIFTLGTSTQIITYNTIRNLTFSGMLAGIEVASSAGVSTCSNNSINTITINNNLSIDVEHYGIFIGSPQSHTCNNNVVANMTLNCTSTGIYSTIYGITIYSGVTSTTVLQKDTVANINVVSSDANTFYPLMAFRILSPVSLLQCDVEGISWTISGAASPIIYGIYASSAGGSTGSIKKCRIVGNYISASSSSATDYGIYFNNTDGWNIYNNTIVSNANDGGNSVSHPTVCIYEQSTGTSTVYHNSVKLYGTCTSGTGLSAAFQKANGSGNVTIKNNIWQNLRTGGGSHYACYTSNAGGTKVFDFNYLETTASPIAYWLGNTSTIANWRTSSGASANEISGTITMDNVDAYSNDAAIKNMGTNTITGVVPDDKNATARSNPPWMGAWETSPPLPISLLNFNVLCENDTVKLRWITSSETNNDFFTIEKSTDAVFFLPVTTIKGAGNSNTLKSYSFTDTQVSSQEQLFYYRLKQTDYDGNYSYSYIVSSACNVKNLEIHIYPNPAGDRLFYTVCTKLEQDIKVDIVNALGQIILSFNQHILPGTNSFSQDISFVLQGIYIFKISGDYNFSQEQFIR